MPVDVTKSEAYKEWLRIRDTIQNYTAVNENETKAVQLKRIARARKDYNYFVQYYFPHYCTNQATGEAVPCASFHIKAAKDILANLEESEQAREGGSALARPRNHRSTLTPDNRQMLLF